MTPKLAVIVRQRDGVTYARLCGVIDEDAGLDTLLDRIAARTVILDLAEVRRINSCGVREWVNWIERLSARNLEVVLVSCPPPIVAQINVITGFAGNGAVKSVLLPYLCPDCDATKLVAVETATIPTVYDPPPCRCDACGSAMEFDDVPTSYLSFLGEQRIAVEDPAAIDGVLAELAPPAAAAR